MSKICFYHFPCADGITALWCVVKAIPNIKYFGIKPQDDQISIDKYKGKDVIFVDVTPSEEKLKHMLEVCSSVIILDHHVSNEKIIAKYKEHKKLNATFDMKLSGCQLAWDHFNEGLRPWFVDYVGDRDLWQFKLPDSKLINTALMELDYLDLKELNTLHNLTLTEENKNKLIKEVMLPTARIIDKKNEKLLKSAMNSSARRVMNFEGTDFNVWVVGGCNSLSSELGNRLMYKKFSDGTSPHFVVLFDYKFDDNIWKISLRSVDIDISTIASSFKGGGHKQAAGFNFKGDLQSLFKKFV